MRKFRAMKNIYLNHTKHYVHLLSRLLHPGWSRSMLLTMHMYPKIALVGSQLIGDEDIITDAGGCVWSDGTPEIIGRWMKELPSHLSYMRPVDYSSAAAIMMRKDVFVMES